MQEYEPDIRLHRFSVAIACIGLIYSVILGCFTFKYRGNDIIKKGNHLFTTAILGAALLAQLNCILLSADVNDSLCVVYPWFGHLSIVAMCCAIWCNIRRVLYLQQQSISKRITQDMYTIPSRDLIRSFALGGSILLLYLTIWTSADRPKQHFVEDASAEQYWYECGDYSKTWALLPFITEYIVLLACAIMTLKTKMHHDTFVFFPESKYVLLGLYNTLFIGSWSIPLCLFSIAEPGARYGVESVSITLVTSVMASTTLGPKLYRVILGLDELDLEEGYPLASINGGGSIIGRGGIRDRNYTPGNRSKSPSLSVMSPLSSEPVSATPPHTQSPDKKSMTLRPPKGSFSVSPSDSNIGVGSMTGGSFSLPSWRTSRPARGSGMPSVDELSPSLLTSAKNNHKPSLHYRSSATRGGYNDFPLTEELQAENFALQQAVSRLEGRVAELSAQLDRAGVLGTEDTQQIEFFLSGVLSPSSSAQSSIHQQKDEDQPNLNRDYGYITE